MDELKELKSVLRSLVVSSATQVDVRALLRDYRNMMGAPLPFAKYGYREPLEFLKERFNDCFLFHGYPANPVLTLIVPDALKHIDKFVQSQKVASNSKSKGKRRSVPDTILGTPPPRLLPNLDRVKAQPSVTANPDISKETTRKSPSNDNAKPRKSAEPEVLKPAKTLNNHKPSPVVDEKSGRQSENKENVRESSGNYSRSDLENFFRRRSAFYSSQHFDNDSFKDDSSGKHTSDSGRQTCSSSSSSKRLQLEELKEEVKQLVLDRPEGVWCTELMKLYREQYHRELNFLRHGYTSIVSFVCSLEPAVHVSAPSDMGDCLLVDARRRALDPSPAPAPVRRTLSLAHVRSSRQHIDPEDALPGIQFDPDVFPEDCMHFMESIPSLGLSDLQPGAMLEVMVGEVYSPSHLWLMRLGDQYNIAMEDTMDEMTLYYSKGEGQERSLALGAVCVGHYCSSVYENDWHRSLIVKILDSDTVKVRHVDYGTVDTVSTSSLRPLLRRWGALPAQAVRARLAGVRPPAAGRRWPRAAAAALLRRVRDKRLVANVVSIDDEEDVMEVFLIDTSTEKDICIGTELIREGHADPRPDCALGTSECYLYPRFHALETGATPNYAEIHAYLRDGIELEYVDDYRRHVPSCLPHAAVRSPSPPPAPATPPLRLEAMNRVPLFHSNALLASTPADSADDSSSECAVFSDTVTDESPPVTVPAPLSAPESTPAPAPTAAPTPATTRAPPPTPAPALSRTSCPGPPRTQQNIMPNYTAPYAAPSMQSLYFPMYPAYGPPPPQFYPRPGPFYSPGPPMQYLPVGPPMSGPPGYPPFYPAPTAPGLRQGWRPQVTPNRQPPASPHQPSHLQQPASPQRQATQKQLFPPQQPAVSSPTVSRPANPARIPPLDQWRPASAAADKHTVPDRRRSPPPPYNGASAGAAVDPARRVRTAQGEVTLTVSECEIFSLLSRVDPNAAHWYMVDAIGRRMGTFTTASTATAPTPAPAPAATSCAENASKLNPNAAEFRQVAATQTENGFVSLTQQTVAPVRPLPDPLRPPPGFES